MVGPCPAWLCPLQWAFLCTLVLCPSAAPQQLALPRGIAGHTQAGLGLRRAGAATQGTPEVGFTPAHPPVLLCTQGPVNGFTAQQCQHMCLSSVLQNGMTAAPQEAGSVSASSRTRIAPTTHPPTPLFPANPPAVCRCPSTVPQPACWQGGG